MQMFEKNDSRGSNSYLTLKPKYSEIPECEKTLSTGICNNSPIHENSLNSASFENIESDYSDYDTDNSFQEFTLKDWLKLVKTLVRKHETPENRSKLLAKYDELQEFFYFFALEYFTGDQNVADLVSSKRQDFVMTWQDVIGPCNMIFDLVVDLMIDINVENSFRL